ncbi:hypothetical protein O9G_001713 [Rozella allomycis CSF55]|uniref:Uncharacterized protein n=1 Tax=Rozella allomycis (strain CSF55) TaxID=988480 RepID=A0A075ASP1_ROZAC|nr:hypothetical protein O9G_001713 [Rozella allomycis CSF55]|eukprot:EPZ33301.1 hypothetical protein O9G_001713 [Rozella allomycis CSF55]
MLSKSNPSIENLIYPAKKSYSIRNDKGKIIPGMILGDPEEFERMERKFIKDTQVDSKRIETSHIAQINHSKEEYDENIRHYLVMQEKSLDNWEKQQTIWNKIDDLICQKTNKKKEELIANKTLKYRLLLEDRELMNQILTIMNKGDNNVGTILTIGNDLTGLVRTLEGKLNFNFTINGILPDLNVAQGGKVDNLTVFGFNKKENSKSLKESRSIPEILREDSGQKSVSVDSVKLEKGKLGSKSFDSFPSIRTEVIPFIKTEANCLLSLSEKYLYFESFTKQICCKAFTLTNHSDQTIHFEWINESNKKKAQAFYFFGKSGSVLAGQSLSFNVAFKSDEFGVWSLKTRPQIQDNIILTLKGISLEKDANKSKREKIEKDLFLKQAKSTAKYIIDTLINQVHHYSETKLRKLILLREETMFNYYNNKLYIFYDPSTIEKFKNLVEEIKQISGLSEYQWTFSIDDIYEIIHLIDPIERRSEFYERLNKLIIDATKPPELKNLKPRLLSLTSAMLCSVADKIYGISNSIRKDMELPLDRPAVSKFINLENIPQASVEEEKNPAPSIETKKLDKAPQKIDSKTKKQNVQPSNTANKPSTPNAKAQTRVKSADLEKQNTLVSIPQDAVLKKSAQKEIWTKERRQKEYEYRKILKNNVSNQLRIEIYELIDILDAFTC